MPKIIFQPLMICNPPYPIDMPATAWGLGITYPQSIKRLGHFLTADCKSAGTPSGGRAYPALLALLVVPSIHLCTYTSVDQNRTMNAQL